MTHRIRHALKETGFAEKLDGTIEADATAVLSATDYNPDPLLKSQIWLMGKDNEERGASMVSVATASIKSDKKKITFVTLIGDAE